MKPKLLDLFCCEGGAAAGYDNAGFDACGVDIEPQPNYPYWFHQGDVLDVLDTLRKGAGVTFMLGSETRTLFIESFAAIHASPPCQAHSTITPDKSKHVDLIPDTRERLQKFAQPWVIENVEGARKALVDPMLLCGSSFGLGVRRHRLFESSVWLMSLPCRHAEQGRPFGVYGTHGDANGEFLRPNGKLRGRKARDVGEARELMGMPWASWHGCAQAIPPAFTEFIGRQLMAHVQRMVA